MLKQQLMREAQGWVLRILIALLGSTLAAYVGQDLLDATATFLTVLGVQVTQRLIRV